MTRSDGPAAGPSGRQLLIYVLIAVVVLFGAWEMRAIYRSGRGDGDREQLKARAAEQERRQAPGPTTPAR